MPEPVWLKKFKGTWLWDDMAKTEDEVTSAKLKVVVGGFYEVLASQILKGEHGDCPLGWDVYPDVILWGKGRREQERCDLLVEVKGAGRKHGFIIDHGQAERYGELSTNTFPFTTPTTYYMFFIHQIERLEADNKTVDQVINVLCNNTIGAILLPLDLVRQWIEWSPIRGYVAGGYGSRGRNGSDGHQYFSRLSGPMVEKWIHTPAELSASMLKLAEDHDGDWSMNGWTVKSNFILGQKVMDKAVSPFLLTAILGKDWRAKL